MNKTEKTLAALGRFDERGNLLISNNHETIGIRATIGAHYKEYLEDYAEIFGGKISPSSGWIEYKWTLARKGPLMNFLEKLLPVAKKLEYKTKIAIELINHGLTYTSPGAKRDKMFELANQIRKNPLIDNLEKPKHEENIDPEFFAGWKANPVLGKVAPPKEAITAP